MQITVKAQGLDKVQKHLAKLSGQQFKAAQTKALNDAAFAVRRAYQDEMRSVFDRPTPYMLRSIQVKMAKGADGVALVGPMDFSGKTVDPAKVLAAEVTGGQRRDKRSEKALRRVGILLPGYQMVAPRDPMPGSEDGYGGLKGTFVRRVLAYLQAFSEVGHYQNTKAKARNKLAKFGRNANGYKAIGGVVFFVSWGRLRSNANGHHSPLAYGVWAKTGTHGAIVRPAILFVKAGTYQRRLKLDEILRKAKVQEVFAKRLRYQIRRALGV